MSMKNIIREHGVKAKAKNAENFWSIFFYYSIKIFFMSYFLLLPLLMSPSFFCYQLIERSRLIPIQTMFYSKARALKEQSVNFHIRRDSKKRLENSCQMRKIFQS